MENRILYEDSDMRIEHHPTSHEDHLIYFHSFSGKEDSRYVLPRGCLRELATTPRDRAKLIMSTLSSIMVEDAEKRNLSVDSLGFAMAQAVIEEDRQYQNWKAKQE